MRGETIVEPGHALLDQRVLLGWEVPDLVVDDLRPVAEISQRDGEDLDVRVVRVLECLHDSLGLDDLAEAADEWDLGALGLVHHRRAELTAGPYVHRDAGDGRRVRRRPEPRRE